MKINRLQNIDTNQFCKETFDLFIFAYRETNRGLYIAKKELNCQKKLILFDDQDVIVNNVSEISGEKEMLILSSDNARRLIEYIDNFIRQTNQLEINIAIDYTSMPQLWYSSILMLFNNLKYDININLYFSYTQSEFYQPEIDDGCSYQFQPLMGYTNITIPSKPTALILGVGFENRRAFSLKEFFDAEEVYIFITDKLSAPQFNQEVYSQNKEIISQMKEDHVLEYPALDILYTRKILFDLCKDLSNDFRVVIAPCGPKTFSLTSAIVATQIPNIDIWRIIGGTKSVEGKEPDGEISHFLIKYEP